MTPAVSLLPAAPILPQSHHLSGLSFPVRNTESWVSLTLGPSPAVPICDCQMPRAEAGRRDGPSLPAASPCPPGSPQSRPLPGSLELPCSCRPGETIGCFREIHFWANLPCISVSLTL